MFAVTEQDQLYWRFIYELVVRHNYRVISLNENGEVWLESSHHKHGTILRLIRYDIDWGNWLIHDIKEATKEIKKVKSQSYRKKMQVLNIYISTYPPVDDWEYQFESAEVGQMETILIEIGNRDQKLAYLFKKLALPQQEFRPWYSEIQDVSYLMQTIREVENSRIQKERAILLAKKPFLTYLLVAINIMMFLLLEWFGSSTDTMTLIKFGAKYNPAILEGEWWRFISPIFLHIGLLHLLTNTLALYYLGIAVERIYGTWRFLLIYFSSGIVGAIVSFAFNAQVSAGASGAIFGCFGALLYFGVVHPGLFFRTMGLNVLSVIGLNLGLGFVVPMIDNGAHIGGLISGFIASAVVNLPNHKSWLRQLAALFVLCLLTGAVLVYGFQFSQQAKNPVVVGQIAGQLIEKGENEQAYQMLSQLVKEQEQQEIPVEVFFLLAYTEAKMGHVEEAAAHLEYVVSKKKNFHEAYYNLALIYFDLQQYEKAKAAIEKAIDLNPNDQQYQILRKQLETMN